MAGIYSMQGVAGDLAAGALTSSEHDRDRASDVTVLEVDMENGSIHGHDDNCGGGGIQEERRGDLETAKGEQGTYARQPHKCRLTMCDTPGVKGTCPSPLRALKPQFQTFASRVGFAWWQCVCLVDCNCFERPPLLKNLSLAYVLP